MEEYNVKFPYKIGTRLQTTDSGTTYVDQLAKYVVKKDGIFVILWLCVDTEPRLSEEIPLAEFLSKWSKIDNKDVKHDKLDKMPKTCFGVTKEEFDKMHEKNNGFNVTLPKDNLPRVSNDFNDFMIRASKGYSETLAKQREEAQPKVKEKTNNNQ